MVNLYLETSKPEELCLSMQKSVQMDRMPMLQPIPTSSTAWMCSRRRDACCTVHGQNSVGMTMFSEMTPKADTRRRRGPSISYRTCSGAHVDKKRISEDSRIVTPTGGIPWDMRTTCDFSGILPTLLLLSACGVKLDGKTYALVNDRRLRKVSDNYTALQDAAMELLTGFVPRTSPLGMSHECSGKFSLCYNRSSMEFA